MSYQVLARKWRPRNFESLVGQEHVVRALTHALREQRLHHAYLLTGTRGVGKTTIARILAKALNCEQGLSATPCCSCSTCHEIDVGRFVDYIEMDAASNRGVDDMTQLLEQATYAPSRGRYKVYVIDEVHQLTGHAFNAMLKTLEEPPEHVKFVLATTDPQKIPVTVLSRCLQFNLKQMSQGAVVDHLRHILAEEKISAELPALRLVARAGAGSMRDSLSLLDQAIAHGAGEVTECGVRDMLGSIDVDHVFGIFDALIAGKPDAILAIADDFAARSMSYDVALQEMASLLVRVQVAQFSPNGIPDDDPARERILELSRSFDPEFIQLAYQIVVQGRQDLPFAPEAASGFMMSLLRLYAFRPGAEAPVKRNGSTPGKAVEAVVAARAMVTEMTPEARMQPPTVSTSNISAVENEGGNLLRLPDAGDWAGTLQSLRLSGMVRELAQHCEFVFQDAGGIRLRLAPTHRHLLVKLSQDRLQNVLSQHFGQALRLQIDVEEPLGETPATQEQRDRRIRHESAVAAVEGDGFVREIVEMFDATLIESTIKPIS